MHRPNIYTALACLLLAPVTVLAQAPTGIELENASFTEHTATGTCGPAKVEISGVDVENSLETRRLIPGWQSSIKVQSGGKSIIIGDGETIRIGLENQNKLHCVATPAGKRLVLAAHCFSTYCLPVSYTIIDPTSLRVLSKGNEEGCDAACAEKALGTPLPAQLKRTDL